MIAGALEQVRTKIDQNFLAWQFFKHKRDQISAKVDLEIVMSKYRARVANSNADFQKVMRLRYEVFTRETRQQENVVRVDLDEFDFIADHLIVEDTTTGAIVGTYRLLCSRFTNEFYSESEFDLKDFLAIPGTKLELGRSCIQKEHRRGAVISLLWRGIVEYACKVRAQYLFGCASLWSNDVNEAAKVYRAFQEQGHLSEQFRVGITPKYTHPEYREDLGQDGSEPEVPSLLRSYLKAGAKVCSGPAYDIEFRCFDYFIVMNLLSMDEAYQTRFTS